MDIGLTGGIASGKSTVADMIKGYDIPIIDADMIARKVVEPGEPALEKLFQLFGEEVRAPDGGLERKKLGAIIFKNEEKRKVLNRVLHPAIRKGMLDQASAYKEQGREHVVFDIPLLFESKLSQMVDQTLLVYVDAQTQLSRLIERDGSTKEEALDRIQSQMPIEEKKELADDVIDNTGTREETEQQLKKILTRWKVI